MEKDKNETVYRFKLNVQVRTLQDSHPPHFSVFSIEALEKNTNKLDNI